MALGLPGEAGAGAARVTRAAWPWRHWPSAVETRPPPHRHGRRRPGCRGHAAGL